MVYLHLICDLSSRICKCKRSMLNCWNIIWRKFVCEINLTKYGVLKEAGYLFTKYGCCVEQKMYTDPLVSVLITARLVLHHMLGLLEFRLQNDKKENFHSCTLCDQTFILFLWEMRWKRPGSARPQDEPGWSWLASHWSRVGLGFVV